MIKFLLIIFVFFFVLSKIGGFVFRTLFGAAAQRGQQQQHQNQQSTRRPTDGNVQIDYVPKKEEKPSKNFKGGDFVDFEEVKE